MANSFQAVQRPQLLKDLLINDSNSTYLNQTSPSFKLLRSRSKAASKTISAIRRASKIVIAAVNYLPFTSVKTPSVSRRSGDGDSDEEVPISITVKVKVKDILRWRSFRDLAEEKPPPSDFASSPHRCTTATTTTASTSTATSSSRSSWCGSDYASEEDLHIWCGDSDDVYCGENKGGSGEGKNFLPGHGVGGNYTEATRAIMMVDSQGEVAWEEEREKHSPVSVLDFSVLQQDEKFISSSPHSLAKLGPLNLEKQFCLEENLFEHHHNGAEEKAKQMLNHVKSYVSTQSCETNVLDHLLLDFFMHELTTSRIQKDDDFLRVAKAWMSGEKDGFLEWEMGGKREVCIREMEMRGVMRWNNFVEEQEEMALQMEAEVLSSLVDEILIDFLNL